jgi:hypothetical protein
MATYQIWADITQLAPDRFFVTVSAVPAHERNEHRTGGVQTAEAHSQQEAQAIRDDLVLALGKKLRARGHVILDLIDESKPPNP